MTLDRNLKNAKVTKEIFDNDTDKLTVTEQSRLEISYNKFVKENVTNTKNYVLLLLAQNPLVINIDRYSKKS